MFFVEVILPLALDQTYTYAITEAEYDYIKPGMRLAVPFGKNKIYTALALEVHQNKPLLYEVREIYAILDEQPIVLQSQLKFWFWIAEYYMCSIGEVYKSAMPSSFLLESETMVLKNKDNNVLESELSDQEHLIIEALEKQNSLKVQEVSNILDKKNVLPLLYKLLNKGIVILQEEIKERYKPKVLRYVRLGAIYQNEDRLKELLDNLRSVRQKEALLKYFQLRAVSSGHVLVKNLTENTGLTSAVIKNLIDKEVFEEYYLQTDRTDFVSNSLQSQPTLSLEQNTALEQIKKNFSEKAIGLLLGVTSSGKTEIYVKLIQEYIQQGKQVVYLLPEIALTTQLVSRLRKVFGNQIAVYHSRHSQNERAEVWYQVLQQSEKARIVIGARSAIFLPFSNLGLVVVDEEHEQTFKQQDPAPRYHARDSALVLAQQHQAKTLLGSATPSIETYYNAQKRKYGLVMLNKRFGEMKLPEIEIVDLKDKYFRKKMSGHFSDTLLEAITHTLEEDRQVILFQNRRGYAPILECTTCGHIPQCPNCDVSLTYHKLKKQIRCHYCGYAIAKPSFCHACSSSSLDTKGFGTEQIQLELEELFPTRKIIRMDRDTTISKFGYEKIIDSFKSREADVLVGTQMLSKGLDFDNVGLVGILQADNMLYYPDFRAYERSYQMMTQVAGRAGRCHKRSKVIIQTYSPNHEIIKKVAKTDYEGMYEQELQERLHFQYPPFYKIIRITLKHRNFDRLQQGSVWLCQLLRNVMNVPILGPEEPTIGRIRNEYLKNILIKIPVTQNIKTYKTVIKKSLMSFEATAVFKSIKVVIDVDC